MSPVTYAVLVAVVIALLYVALSLQLYRRPFLPPRPISLDDLTFTPFEFQAAIAFARKRIPNARICLLGYSMGAVVSLLGAAGEPGVQALILDSPFSDLRRLLVENVRSASKLPGTPFVWLAGLLFWLRTRCTLSACRPIDVLSALEPRPLFFIHGGADALTNVNHSRRLYDAYRGPREIWIVQGAPHTGAYFADRPLYVERVAGFFARHLGLDVSSHLRLVEEEEVS